MRGSGAALLAEWPEMAGPARELLERLHEGVEVHKAWVRAAGAASHQGLRQV